LVPQIDSVENSRHSVQLICFFAQKLAFRQSRRWFQRRHHSFRYRSRLWSRVSRSPWKRLPGNTSEESSCCARWWRKFLRRWD